MDAEKFTIRSLAEDARGLGAAKSRLLGFVVECECGAPVSRVEGIEICDRLVDVARSEIRRQEKLFDFFVLAIEEFDGIGAKSRYFRRMKELSKSRYISSKIIEIPFSGRPCLVYLVMLKSGWQEFIEKVNYKIGLLCASPKGFDEQQLPSVVEFLRSNLLSESAVIQVGVASVLEKNISDGMFYFSGDFDDSWRSLVVVSQAF
jgi:hypothetical protein